MVKEKISKVIKPVTANRKDNSDKRKQKKRKTEPQKNKTEKNRAEEAALLLPFFL
jgi:hypothetical protein